jgi:UDP-N-acetyl-2-amino-2-deoxyglucuronate dehydrogenase
MQAQQGQRQRVAIIGCGNIGRNHARSWKAIPEHVQIAAIADSNEEALEEAGDAWGIPGDRAYLDFREMLEREHPDIVSVATWTGLHAPATIAAAARRPKLILCEKPMAASLGEADAMLVACKRNGVKLAIGHMRRFFRGWEEARRLIAEGAIGHPVRVWSSVPEGLLNWGTHVIDGVRFILGDPPAEWVMGAVSRETDRYERGVRIEDAAMGLVQFGAHNGHPPVQATFQIDLGPTRHWQVIGTEGIIEANEGRVRMLDGRAGGWRELEGSEMTFQDAFNAQARAVAEWAAGEALALPGGTEARLAGGGAAAPQVDYRGSGQSARATLEICLAIYESARMHEVTRLPLQTREYPLDLMIESGHLATTRPGAYDIRSHLVRGEAMQWK